MLEKSYKPLDNDIVRLRRIIEADFSRFFITMLEKSYKLLDNDIVRLRRIIEADFSRFFCCYVRPPLKVPNWFAYNKQINQFICTNVASAHFIITMLEKLQKLINNKLFDELLSLSNYY